MFLVSNLNEQGSKRKKPLPLVNSFLGFFREEEKRKFRFRTKIQVVYLLIYANVSSIQLEGMNLAKSQSSLKWIMVIKECDD